MSVSFQSEFETQVDEPAVLAHNTLRGFDSAAPAGVVNRTHRVVRHRASVMQARRSYVRSLTFPLILCSVLLVLTVFAVWSGLYQYQAVEAAEAVQADVASLDANNHFLVVLLWFVPVSLALLAAIWVRHSKNGGSETTR
jgi:hypothetical protein